MVSPADIVTQVSRLTSRHRLLAAGAEAAEVTEAVRTTNVDELVSMTAAGFSHRGRRSEAHRDLADVELLRGHVPEEDEGW